MSTYVAEPLLGDRLDPAELTAVATAFARASDGWRHQVRFDKERWFTTLVHADARCDVWVSTWLPGQSTGPHHHHGSATAMVVVEGYVVERRLNRLLGRLVRRRHRPGRTTWVAPGTLHDVQNASRHAAISVHAYSPPLLRTSLASYDEPAYNTRADELVPVAS